MASFTSRYSVGSTLDQTIHQASGWCDLVVQLDAAAPGDTKLGLGSTLNFVLNPGTPVRMMIAPGTEVKVSTNSGINVEVCCMVTELEFIQQLIDCLQGVGNMAAVGAGLLRPLITPPK